MRLPIGNRIVDLECVRVRRQIRKSDQDVTSASCAVARYHPVTPCLVPRVRHAVPSETPVGRKKRSRIFLDDPAQALAAIRNRVVVAAWDKHLWASHGWRLAGSLRHDFPRSRHIGR